MRQDGSALVRTARCSRPDPCIRAHTRAYKRIEIIKSCFDYLRAQESALERI